jgi:hypothetical protein
MEDNFTPDPKNELVRQLQVAKKEIETLRRKQDYFQYNPQDKFIETLFDKGGEILIEYTKINSEIDKHQIDKKSEIEKEELTTIIKLDTKEKIFKGILIGICLLSLIIIPIFIKESQMIIPVLSLVIGLLFKSNSVTDFIAFRKKNKTDNDE